MVVTHRCSYPFYIEPGNPWKSGYIKGIKSKLRVELLNGEIFYIWKEAKTLIEKWRLEYTRSGHTVR